MRNTLIKLVFLIAAFFSFTSCDLDSEGTYTFYYSLHYAVEKEETGKALEKYFKDRIDFEENFQFTGALSNTMALANEKFIKQAEATLVHDEVLEILGEKDIAVLYLNVIIKTGGSIVGQIAWYHTDEDTIPMIN